MQNVHYIHLGSNNDAKHLHFLWTILISARGGYREATGIRRPPFRVRQRVEQRVGCLQHSSDSPTGPVTCRRPGHHRAHFRRKSTIFRNLRDTKPKASWGMSRCEYVSRKRGAIDSKSNCRRSVAEAGISAADVAAASAAAVTTIVTAVAASA